MLKTTAQVMEALNKALEEDDIEAYKGIKNTYGIQELWEYEEDKGRLEM